MLETIKNKRIMNFLLREFTTEQTITSLASRIGMSRTGMWKALKKMQLNNLVILSPIGSGRTSTFKISLNLNNPLTKKTLSFYLTEEALKNKRWMDNFAALEDKVNFLVLYGSILHSPKRANDIDILVMSDSSKFIGIDEEIKKIQKTQAKKIHALSFTQSELKNEVKMLKNKSLIDATKKGVILFGQDNFIEFIKEISTK